MEPLISKDVLEKEYYSGKTYKEIAILYNISEKKLQKLGKRYAIKARNRGIPKINLELNTVINNLLILDIPKEKNKWKCQCICGNIVYRSASNITRNKNMCNECKKKNLHKIHYKGHFDISSSFWTILKQSARVRNIKVDVTITDIWGLFLKQNKKCALTGIDINFDKSRNKKHTASLDRIDSSKDYTLDNIQWVHKNINLMKMDLSQEEFIKFCKLVTEHNNV